MQLPQLETMCLLSSAPLLVPSQLSIISSICSIQQITSLILLRSLKTVLKWFVNKNTAQYVVFVLTLILGSYGGYMQIKWYNAASEGKKVENPNDENLDDGEHNENEV